MRWRRMQFWSPVVILKYLAFLITQVHQSGASCPGVTHIELNKIMLNASIDGPVFYSTVTQYEQDCQLHCHGVDHCWGYNYHFETGQCQLMDRCSSNFKAKLNTGWTARFQTCKLANLCLRDMPLDSDGNCNCSFPWMGDICEKNVGYYKENTGPVCFNSKNDDYGKFFISHTGKIKNFRFVHISGGVTVFSAYQGNWGTNVPAFFNNDNLEVYIVNTARQRLYPTADMKIYPDHYTYHYRLPGRKNMDPELTLSDFSPPLSVTAGQELRLFFGQDYMNIFESDNIGISCTDVYASYV